jgi:hypothetical protein
VTTNGQLQPQQIDLNTPMAVTLPFGAWNTMLGLIMKGPWETANPLIQAIQTQLQKYTQAAMQQPQVIQPGSPGPGPTRRIFEQGE